MKKQIRISGFYIAMLAIIVIAVLVSGDFTSRKGNSYTGRDCSEQRHSYRTGYGHFE